VRVQFSLDGRQLAAVTASAPQAYVLPDNTRLPDSQQLTAHLFIWRGRCGD
jgi:hypothetical protein